MFLSISSASNPPSLPTSAGLPLPLLHSQLPQGAGGHIPCRLLEEGAQQWPRRLCGGPFNLCSHPNQPCAAVGMLPWPTLTSSYACLGCSPRCCLRHDARHAVHCARHQGHGKAVSYRPAPPATQSAGQAQLCQARPVPCLAAQHHSPFSRAAANHCRPSLLPLHSCLSATAACPAFHIAISDAPRAKAKAVNQKNHARAW